MIEHAHWIIDQLEYDLGLIGMTGSPLENPYDIHIGPSILELIDIDEIVELDDLEITTSHAGSSVSVSAPL